MTSISRRAAMAGAILSLLSAWTPTSINPKDYGVTFSGADDTAGWQNAVNAAVAQGLPLQAPCGTSTIYGEITVSGPLTFAGSGLGCTYIMLAASNQNAVLVNTTAAVTFRDFTLECLGSGDWGIYVDTPTGWNQGSTFTHIQIAHCYVGIDFATAASWVIDGSIIYCDGAGMLGIDVRNIPAPDSGDSTIVNSTLSSPGCPYGILQRQSGGLRIENNKIIGWQYGYRMDLWSSTSDLFIIGNSFENSTYAALAFSRQSGTFSNIAITGNELSSSGYCIQGASGAGWLSSMGITGNRLICPSGLALGTIGNVVSSGNF